MISMREICEYLAKKEAFLRDDGTPMTAIEIWNSSPTGELWHILSAYRIFKTADELGQV